MSTIVPRSYFEPLIGQICSDHGWDLDDVICFLHRVVEERRFDILDKRGTQGVWVISTKRIPTKQSLSEKPVKWSVQYADDVSYFRMDQTVEFTVSLKDGAFKCLVVTLPYTLPIHCVARSPQILHGERINVAARANQDMKMLNLCFNCLQKPVQRKRCSRCSVASYCSETCQKKDWPRHKHQCQKDQEDRNAPRIIPNFDNVANVANISRSIYSSMLL